jgi:hypothetical protein
MGVTAINGVAITSSLANTSSTINITNTTTGTGPYYPVFVDSTSGGRLPRVDSSTFTYNATTNALTAASFVGTASRSVTSSTSENIRVNQTTTNAAFYPLFTPTFNGGAPVAAAEVNNSNQLTYNPSTKELRAGILNRDSTAGISRTTDGNVTVDASLTQSLYWVASFTATRSLIISNLTSGRQVRVWIRNTNATQRHIIFSGSTSAASHTGFNVAVSAGGASAIVQPIAGSSGTMFLIAENIANNIVGGLM